MKKIIYLVIISLILIGLAKMAFADVSDGSDIKVTLVNQEPDPVEPGGYVDIRFRIENLGGDTAKDVYVKLTEDYPFSLEPGKEAELSIGSLESRQIDPDGVIVKYRLKVDEDAVEGAIPIELGYKFGIGERWIKPEEFYINVRTYDIVLSVESVYSTPEIIPPGETAKVKIGFKNMADSAVKDIKIRLDLSSSSLPFVPVHSTAEKKIYQIVSKGEDSVYFDIMAMADADAGAYKIPIDITYSDDVGTQYSKDDIISLIVGDEPDLSVMVDSSEIYKKNSYGTVVIKFVNKGLSDVKLLNVKLAKSDGFEVVSPEEVYIGDIDSDDYETAEFDIYVGDSDELILPVTMEYMDANNKEFSEKREVTMRLFSASEAKRYGLEESRIVGIVIILVIVGAGFYFFYWRKRRKKKKK
jgi:hypothetical protein